MAGRGRGRGRGFSSEPMPAGLSINKADLAPIPKSDNEPLPLYPPMQHKPGPLHSDIEWTYLIRCKKQFQWSMDCTPYKVEEGASKHAKIAFEPAWPFLPTELQLNTKTVKPSSKRVKKEKKSKHIDIKKRLQELESRECQDSDDEADSVKETKKAADSDEENVSEREADVDDSVEEVDEEEQLDADEGADYVSSYFDGGEGYLDDEDENIDEPTY